MIFIECIDSWDFPMFKVSRAILCLKVGYGRSYSTDPLLNTAQMQISPLDFVDHEGGDMVRHDLRGGLGSSPRKFPGRS